MKLKNEVQQLLQEGVISQEVANRINTYYSSKPDQSRNRILVVFGVLGALLVGLGIILILAHNWDQFSRNTKAFLAFLPLIIGQGLCIYTIQKQSTSQAWRETSATLLFFGLGASISLVGQVYHINGTMSGFLFIWMLLCLPLIYIMNSYMVALLYILGITAFGVIWKGVSLSTLYPRYLILLAGVIPFYGFQIMANSKSNFLKVIHWVFPISLGIASIIFFSVEAFRWAIPLLSLFTIFILVGLEKTVESETSSYRVLGNIGVLVLLFILSFEDPWEWDSFGFGVSRVETSTEFFIALIYFLIASGLVIRSLMQKPRVIMPLTWALWLVFICYYIIGSPIFNQVLINLFLFGLGIFYVMKGAQSNSLTNLNFGLSIISFLVLFRFFDENVSFVVRGVVFLLLGLGFFLANYSIVQKNKQHD